MVVFTTSHLACPQEGHWDLLILVLPSPPGPPSGLPPAGMPSPAENCPSLENLPPSRPEPAWRALQKGWQHSPHGRGGVNPPSYTQEVGFCTPPPSTRSARCGLTGPGNCGRRTPGRRSSRSLAYPQEGGLACPAECKSGVPSRRGLACPQEGVGPHPGSLACPQEGSLYCPAERKPGVPSRRGRQPVVPCRVQVWRTLEKAVWRALHQPQPGVPGRVQFALPSQTQTTWRALKKTAALPSKLGQTQHRATAYPPREPAWRTLKKAAGRTRSPPSNHKRPQLQTSSAPLHQSLSRPWFLPGGRYCAPPPPVCYKPPVQCALAPASLGNLGERGLTLSRSRQQGRSTTYRTRTHIKVVCKGFVPARPKLQSARRRRLTFEATETQPNGAQGRSLFSHVCARGSIAAFRHGF